MIYKNIRISPESLAVAKEITEGDNINFPSIKNVYDKAVFLLKQKIDFDKISTLPKNSNKKEWLKKTKLPETSQTKLSLTKLKKLNKKSINDGLRVEDD